jgi:hypothetical protein
MGEEIKQGLTLQSTAHEKPRTGLPLYRNILFDIFSTAKVQQNFETTKTNSLGLDYFERPHFVWLVFSDFSGRICWKSPGE